jgi:CRP-like cAMP-binding protein
LNEQEFSAGETIVREGDPVDNIYLIVSGTADVRCFLQFNLPTETKSVATLGPGDAIGMSETGLYSLSGKRTATVIALTDMVLLRLSVAVLHGFELSHSHVQTVMAQNAASLLGNDPQS